MASALSRMSSAAVLIGSLVTAALRVAAADARIGERPAWLVALGVTLGLLALRLIAMARAARRGALAWPRLLLPAIFGLEAAGLFIADGDALWQRLRFATAISLELAVIAIAIVQVRRAAPGDELPEDRLARPLGRLLPPRAARLIAFELVIIGSALRHLAGGWRRPEAPGHSYHRHSRLRMLLPLLPLLAIGDVALLEIVVLPRAAPWVRIVVHVLALYGVIWLIGLWATIRRRPHQIAEGTAHLHRGMLGHVDLALDQIASVGRVPAFTNDWKARAYRKRAIRLEVAGATALDIRLRAPVQPIGLLGPGRPSDHLIVGVDDPEAFVAALGLGARPATPAA